MRNTIKKCKCSCKERRSIKLREISFSLLLSVQTERPLHFNVYTRPKKGTNTKRDEGKKGNRKKQNGEEERKRERESWGKRRREKKRTEAKEIENENLRKKTRDRNAQARSHSSSLRIRRREFSFFFFLSLSLSRGVRSRPFIRARGFLCRHNDDRYNHICRK